MTSRNKNFFSITLKCLLVAICVFSASAKDAVFSGENYSISLSYNDAACPGDAIFIRMRFADTSKKPKHQAPPTTAIANLVLEDKNIASSAFYIISESSTRNRSIMLTGIPLSSWWTQGNYHITVVYSFEGGKNMEFNLPFAIISKTFNSETIPLDQKNTAIKTDTSPQRMKQIDTLNTILQTVDSEAVYQDRPYTPPTTSTRRTSYFADRRVYAYTNGKSSTSLHFGTDYGVPTGTTVTACAAGKVVLAENRVSTGWSVVIEHLPGLYSLYYHMSKLSVKVDDQVKMGDMIGLSGATGLATGPHLHWEMRLNMEAVNPDFFTGDFSFSGATKN
jgi:murein DD-endopeptidase MepM/ murein hydrolase activator NlpD